MKKIVYNTCFGGFGLSLKAQIKYLIEIGKNIFIYKEIDSNTYKLITEEEALLEKKNWLLVITTTNYGSIATTKEVYSNYFNERDIKRDDLILVKIVEELKEEANGDCANLQIVEIEGKWRIDEYDGNESVETPDSYHWND